MSPPRPIATSPQASTHPTVKTTTVPSGPMSSIFSPTPKPRENYQQPSQVPSNVPISEPSTLTPLRAHYLKRELVTLQFAAELETLSTPDSLSLLGPPFLPKNHFLNGIPISPNSHSSSSNPLSKSAPTRAPCESRQNLKNNNSQIPESIELPFLRFFFHRFVLTFPFLTHSPSTFFSQKLQPFVYSFFSRNISGSHDREEQTKRRRISSKVEKHLGLVMAAAIKLTDNGGEEQVVRVSNEQDSRPNPDDAFLSTPTFPSSPSLPNSSRHTSADNHHPSGTSPARPGEFDVNVVAIRRVPTKGRMRTKVHEEFVIRTRSRAAGEVYVSRRYGEFAQLAEVLRIEFPDLDIPGPPAKDRRAIDTTMDDATANSPPSTNNPSSAPDGPLCPSTENSTLVHFTREKNRLTLRGYIHRLLAKAEIANSDLIKDFLLNDPIKLTPLERQDVDNREAMDRSREKEKMRFRTEVEGRVRELDGYLRGFREELVKSDGLSRVFGTIREVDRLEKLPIEYRKVIEWGRISLASTIYQIFLGSDNSSASFAQLKRMHGLMPYWGMRGVLKVSNPVAMIRGIIDLFLARPFGATSLVQRMFTSGLYDEIRELKEDAEKVASKISDDRMCQKIKTYVEAPREIQEAFEADSKNENLDLMSIIMRSLEAPKFDHATYQRIHRAAMAYEAYKTYRDGLEHQDLNEGPDNDDAWLFEDLHVYLKLLRRCRDKEQLIELIFEGTTSELLKDIVTIFYSPLMQVYKAANISDSLGDLQKWIDDLIKTVERAEMTARDPQKIVQTFVDLVQRHEGAFYQFVHQVHSKGAGLFDGLMHWIELFVNFVRNGLAQAISLEALLPHPDTTERLELMGEIDSIIDYHRKLKIAHQVRMTRRLARAEGVVGGGATDEDYARDRDAAFVAGVMGNLNLSKVVEADVGEAVNQDIDESDEEEDGDSSRTSISSLGSPPDGNRHHRRKIPGTQKKSKKSDPIEPPQLKIVPTLTPLFTELVRQLLR